MPDATATGVALAGGQHPDIYPGSPVALLGVFVTVLQARFFQAQNVSTPDERLPWFWTPTPTPDTDAGGALPGDTFEQAQPGRRVYIESAQEHPTARNMLPAILVNRGVISSARDSVGHRVDFVPHNNASLHTCMLQMPLSIDCCAQNSGESDSLADLIFHFLLASGPDICGAFGLHTIEPPALNPPEVLRRSSADVEAWKTTVYTTIMFQVYWRRWQMASVLNEIQATLATDQSLTTFRTVLQRRSAG